jgi:phenylpyruvate tautomerase PptA (4-oxalocrotonate tautomerase family)
VTFTPAQVVTPPASPGLRYGLFNAAVGPLDLPDHAIGGGVTWPPESCGGAHAWGATCHEPTVDRGGDGDQQLSVSKTVDDAGDWATASPFVAYGSYTCGSVGTGPEELSYRARLRLQNGEQSQAEAALAAQLAASSVEVFAADAASIAAVVAELEQWLYGTAGYGTVGYLHAPPRVSAWAMQAGLIEPAGPVLTTRLGTRWVFGGGYPDDAYLHISGLVTVWRSPDIITPPPQLDRSTNQWTALAERPYAVGFDCHAARAFFDWLPLS